MPGVLLQHGHDYGGIARVERREDFADAVRVDIVVKRQDALGQRRLAAGAVVDFDQFEAGQVGVLGGHGYCSGL